MSKTMMQEGQDRLTLNRSRGGKWTVHVNGIRKPGITTAKALEIVEELLRNESMLQGIMIETLSIEE